MKTLMQLTNNLQHIPINTSWLLSDLGEAKGKQELFTKQSPQKLKILREHAVIESAVSSNRIEGVTIDQKRIVSIDMIRKILNDLNKQGKLQCSGRGQNAFWRKCK